VLVGGGVVGLSQVGLVGRLLGEEAHEAYCAPIDTLDPAAAGATLDELLDRRDAVAAQIRELAAEYRRRVDAQYDAVFGAPQ
jgi:hypothetical protein